MVKFMAPERPAKTALPRSLGRTRRRAERRSRRNRPVVMRWPVALPRTPAQPLAARREPVLSSEPEGAAATPPQGGALRAPPEWRSHVR